MDLAKIADIFDAILGKREEPLVTREGLEKVIDGINELEPSYRLYLKNR